MIAAKRLGTVLAVLAHRPTAGGHGRTLYTAGSRIDPQLTVAFSDESGASYRTLGDSTPLPAGLRIRYETNRPQVVSVRDGILAAEQPGVATVTVTVHHHGRSARGTFVVLARPYQATSSISPTRSPRPRRPRGRLPRPHGAEQKGPPCPESGKEQSACYWQR